jgi:hypothetical protein
MLKSVLSVACLSAIFSIACSSSSDGGSGGSSSGGSSSGGSSSGGSTTGGSSSGGSTAGGGATSGGAAGTGASTAKFGTIGTGEVACSTTGDGKSCSSGMACCDQYPFAPKTCVTSFDACKCAQPGSGCGEVDGCDGPEDCPGAVCCAILSRPNLHGFAGTSCKPSCDPTTESIVCKANSDCPSKECTPTGTSFSQCF